MNTNHKQLRFWMALLYAGVAAHLTFSLLEYMNDGFVTFIHPEERNYGDSYLWAMVKRLSYFVEISPLLYIFGPINFYIVHRIHWRHIVFGRRISTIFGLFLGCYFFLFDILGFIFNLYIEAGIDSIYLFGVRINHNIYFFTVLIPLPIAIWSGLLCVGNFRRWV